MVQDNGALATHFNFSLEIRHLLTVMYDLHEMIVQGSDDGGYVHRGILEFTLLRLAWDCLSTCIASVLEEIPLFVSEEICRRGNFKDIPEAETATSTHVVVQLQMERLFNHTHSGCLLQPQQH